MTTRKESADDRKAAEIASRRSVAATPDTRGSFGCTSGQAFTPAASVQDDKKKTLQKTASS
jgi:hypothetical protein